MKIKAKERGQLDRGCNDITRMGKAVMDFFKIVPRELVRKTAST